MLFPLSLFILFSLIVQCVFSTKTVCSSNSSMQMDSFNCSYLLLGNEDLPMFNTSSPSIDFPIDNQVFTIPDFNGDGVPDFILGDTFADPDFRINVGAVFAVKTSSDYNDFFNYSIVEDFETNDGISFIGGSSQNPIGRFYDFGGDIDGDGNPDFALLDSYQMPPTLYIIYGSGTDDVVDVLPDQPAISKILIDTFPSYGGILSFLAGFDFDNDGFNDIVICNPSLWSSQGECNFLFGSSVRPPSENYTDTNPNILGRMYGDPGGGIGYPISSLGDINNDGYDDLFFGAQFNSGKNYILFGGDRTNYFSPDPGAIADINLLPNLFYIDTTQSYHFISNFVDINGDGYLDFFFFTNLTTLGFFFGNSTPYSNYSSFPSPNATIACANCEFNGFHGNPMLLDWNKDGHMDLLFAYNTIGHIMFGFPDWWSNITDLTVSSSYPHLLINGPNSISEILWPGYIYVYPDLNNDGYLELGVIDQDGPTYIITGRGSCEPGYKVNVVPNKCVSCPLIRGVQYNPVTNSNTDCNSTTFLCPPGQKQVQSGNQWICEKCPLLTGNFYPGAFNPEASSSGECTFVRTEPCDKFFYTDVLDSQSGLVICRHCNSSDPSINPEPSERTTCDCSQFQSLADKNDISSGCVFSASVTADDSRPYMLLGLTVLAISSIVFVKTKRYVPLLVPTRLQEDVGIDTLEKWKPPTHHKMIKSLKRVVKLSKNGNKNAPSRLFDGIFTSMFYLFSFPHARRHILPSRHFNTLQKTVVSASFRVVPFLPSSKQHLSTSDQINTFATILSFVHFLAIIFRIPAPWNNSVAVFFPIFNGTLMDFGNYLYTFWGLFSLCVLSIIVLFLHFATPQLASIRSQVPMLFWIPIMFYMSSPFSCTNMQSDGKSISYITASLEFNFNTGLVSKSSVECFTPQYYTIAALGGISLFFFVTLFFSYKPLHSRFYSIHPRYFRLKAIFISLSIFIVQAFSFPTIFPDATFSYLALFGSFCCIVILSLVALKYPPFIPKENHPVLIAMERIFYFYCGFIILNAVLALLVDDSNNLASAIVFFIGTIGVLVFSGSALQSVQETNQLKNLHVHLPTIIEDSPTLSNVPRPSEESEFTTDSSATSDDEELEMMGLENYTSSNAALVQEITAVPVDDSIIASSSQT